MRRCHVPHVWRMLRRSEVVLSSVDFRTSCDSAVALPAATANRATLFAKNSDRMPHTECQHLVQVPAGSHRPGSKLRCQYLEIDQVEHTHAVLLSSPYWLWGAEHGVNEHAVAIGNHTIFTKDAVASSGLLGMDLVRLGLERGATADAAIAAIIELIERYGQGGSGYVDTDWPYHNSFLVADPVSAFVLEASGSNWALKSVEGVAAASNHTTIGTDWHRLSADCVEHARRNGWWTDSGQARFDFAAAYRDVSVVPPVVSSGRYRANCEALADGAGRLDAAAFRRMMRDHFEGGDLYRPGHEPDDDRFFCVCRHDAVGATTASMVAELRSAGEVPVVCWVTFCNPCIAPYLPVFPHGEVPAELQQGGGDRSTGGAWWRFKDVLTSVESDYVRLAPIARDFWAPFEESVRAEVEAELAEFARSDLDAASRRARLTEIMSRTWARASRLLDQLVARLAEAAR